MTTDEIFEKWTTRLRAVFDLPEADRQAAMVAATTEMWEEDPALICHWDNCTDGCCPGDLLLSRITHPQLSPEMVIRMFPEMLKLTDCRTHKTVISETA